MGGRNLGETVTAEGKADEERPDMAGTRGAGPVLIAGEHSRAVLEALKQLNKDLAVEDRGAYWRVTSPVACRLSREAVERCSGEPFRLPIDLEALMPSFAGRFSVDEEDAVWEAV